MIENDVPPDGIEECRKLSRHFTMTEATFSQTATRFGIMNYPNKNQLMNLHVAAECLEQVRTLLGKPILISSWLRVPILNTIIGGAKTSAHCSGWAIDFTCPEFGNAKDVALAISGSKIRFDQCVYEGSWVHISFAPTMRQEVLTAHFDPGKVTYTEGIA